MKTRNEITNSSIPKDNLILEVLLDIRDLLTKPEVGVQYYQQTHPMTPTSDNGDWCERCGTWKQYCINDTHHCTGYKVTC